MSILGEAVLTASIECLIKKLASSNLLKFTFTRQERINADLKKWENLLTKIYAVLEDAEEKQITNLFVKNWLMELKNLAYDVEDILDELQIRVQESELLSSSKVRMLIPSCFANFSTDNVKIESEIKEITARLEDIVEQRNNFDLRETLEGRCNKVRDRRLPSTSLNEDHVYGRERDQEAIVELLLNDGAGKVDGICVIPIVGIGGVGKTTLAQRVYNDARVKSHFDMRSWVCVSDDFDVTRVTKLILLSLGLGASDTHDLNQLQVEANGKIFERKFLIVLDDVWNENYDDWTVLLRPFRACLSGSKIIVTTRSDYVSSMVGTHTTYRLKELPYDDCFSVFAFHSIGRKDFHEHGDLKDIGEKIVRKCKGLPLAAKTLGGILRGKVNRDEWERVLNSKIWSLPEERSDIMPALRLSYYHLPSYLKPCFAYFSLVPKDYEFQKDEMILLWMAQGLLQEEFGDKPMEDFGDECFLELQSRSFFQQSSMDTSRYVMHDLINDLAQWVAGDTFFLRMDDTNEGKKLINTKTLRHLSFVSGPYDGIRKFQAFYGVKDLSKLTYNGGLHDGVRRIHAFNGFKQLRTFLPFKKESLFPFNLSCEILNVLPKLYRLKVLSLRGYRLKRLPDTIGDLKHLRYFDLCDTLLHVLPETISGLYNLQTLKLVGCYNLKKLCTDIGNLINLRFLTLDSTKLEGMPLRIGELTSLRTLSMFVVRETNGSQLKELKFLKHLRGSLIISGLQNVKDLSDAKEADLYSKQDLKELSLEWSCYDTRNAEVETVVLDLLRPCDKLEELSILGYGGMGFPAWLGHTSFSNLVLLRFENCSNCLSLPSVGQLPSLRVLEISCLAGIKRVGYEFYGKNCSRPFPLLEILRFQHMPDWEEWTSDKNNCETKGFPLLRELSIVRCPKLQGSLPEYLPSIKCLVIERCEQLAVSVSGLPTSCWVEINGCKDLEQRCTVNPTSYILSGIGSHMFLIEKSMQSSSSVEYVDMVGHKKRKSFFQSGIVQMENSPNHFRSLNEFRDQLFSSIEKEESEPLQAFPCRRQYLTLWNSICHVKLAQALHSLRFLVKICIANCPELASLPETTLPSCLSNITVESCDALESLPKTWMDCNSVQILSVTRCKSLTYIARNRLPPILRQLRISDCDNLQILIEGENNGLPATLDHISISRCPRMILLSSNGSLPKALKFLSISFCSKLESVAETLDYNIAVTTIHIRECENIRVLPNSGWSHCGNLKEVSINSCEKLVAWPKHMHLLNHLQTLEISSCSTLVSFPADGFPSSKLTSLTIENCEKLEALPHQIHHLTCLQSLEIENCPGIKSFPVDGFPTSLASLSLAELNIFDPIFKWGLHRLIYLRHLCIEGCRNVVSFPPEESCIMLPTSLTILRIIDFPNLECISSSILSLNSLEDLQLSNCAKLKLFPDKGLPLSLLKLFIGECPLLQPKCREGRGKYWPMISHIPRLSKTI